MRNIQYLCCGRGGGNSYCNSCCTGLGSWQCPHRCLLSCRIRHTRHCRPLRGCCPHFLQLKASAHLWHVSVSAFLLLLLGEGGGQKEGQ